MLTDLKMPDLDGMKIVQLVRRERAEMPVVIITGYGTPATRAQARRLGVVGYLEKPFAPEQISEVVLQAWTRVESDTATVDAMAAPADVKELAAKYGYDDGALIQILLDIQNARGYLPKECLFGISAEMGIPLNRIYQAATFYKAFSLEPRGKHLVQVCTGTACHVRGAPTLATRAAGILEVGPGNRSLRVSIAVSPNRKRVSATDQLRLHTVIAASSRRHSRQRPPQQGPKAIGNIGSITVHTRR